MIARTRFPKSCHLTAIPHALVLGLSCIAPAAAAAPKPNIVYVLTDQWRASAFGFAGDPNVKTPQLDKLAARSVRFSNAVSVCPVCTPYRAALLTGRYPTPAGERLYQIACGQTARGESGRTYEAAVR